VNTVIHFRFMFQVFDAVQWKKLLVGSGNLQLLKLYNMQTNQGQHACKNDAVFSISTEISLAFTSYKQILATVDVATHLCHRGQPLEVHHLLQNA